MVLRLREAGPSPIVEKALAELCEIYWYPLYVFARRSGHSSQDAEDLTQGFFERLLERDLFSKADPSRGRLRSFLLGAFKNFISEEWRQANRQKRGGGQSLIPLHHLQLQEVESRISATGSGADPESSFDHIWFDTLLDHALNDLEEEYRRRGKSEVFHRLQEFLAWNRKDAKLAEVAARLKMSPGAVRVTILRMRQRFRELIEHHIAETVETPSEAAEELAHLRRVLAPGG